MPSTTAEDGAAPQPLGRSDRAGPGRRAAFTPAIDALVREIDALGAHQELWRYLYRHRREAPHHVLERDLTAMRDRLRVHP